MDKNCSSCGRRVDHDSARTEFPCPKCGNTVMIRCGHCRSVVAKYVCHQCGFEGPN